MSKPIHVAITRRVRPGYEMEFQQALQEFFATSLGHPGVQGAHMLVPPPGATTPEFGILRTFAGAKEQADFYQSPLFLAWEERIKPLTEGEPVYRQLSGLEAWFRSPSAPPPRWKMALLTWIAVWPVSWWVGLLLRPLLSPDIPSFLVSGILAAGIVLILTWIAMPLLVRLVHRWLHP
jgi:antibiotic biosynthesis monooxygenase (ABM) superfamily enzyme